MLYCYDKSALGQSDASISVAYNGSSNLLLSTSFMKQGPEVEALRFWDRRRWRAFDRNKLVPSKQANKHVRACHGNSVFEDCRRHYSDLIRKKSNMISFSMSHKPLFSTTTSTSHVDNTQLSFHLLLFRNYFYQFYPISFLCSITKI